MRELLRSTTGRYVAAVAIVLAAALLLQLLTLAGASPPSVLFFLAIIAAAWVGGMGPALLATALAVGLVSAVHLAAHWSEPLDGAWVVRMLLSAGVGAGIAVLGGAMRRAFDRAEAAAAEAIAQREELRTTLASIGDGVIVTDPEGRVASLNPVAEALTGWTSTEAAGRPLEDVFVIFNEQTREPAESPVRRALREGRVVGLANHTVLRAKGGREFPIDDSAAPICAADGRLTGVVLVFRDVAERRSGEDRAAERTRQLQLVADSVPVLIAHCDPDQRFKFVNRPYARRFGLKPAAVVGKTIPELLGPAAAGVLAPHIQRVLRGERVEYEAEVPYKDGPQFMRCAYEPEFDAAGRVVGFIASIHNITDRRRAESHLQTALNRLHLALDSARLGDWSWDAVTDQLTLSPRAARVLGVPSDAPTTYTGFLELLPEEDRLRVQQVVGQAVAAGNRYQVEYRVNCPDGSQSWVSSSGQAYYGPAGNPLGMYGVVQDVTQRRRAEDALKESDERFRQLAEHVTDVFWLRDVSKGRMLYVSPAFESIWVRPSDDLFAGMDAFLDAIHPEDRGRVAAALRRQDAGEQTAEEYRVVRPDGAVRWVWERAFPVRTEAGQVYRVAGIAEDVTDRKRAEQDARFLAAASAELGSLVDIDRTLQQVASLAVPFFCDWMAVDLVDESGELRRVAAAHADPKKVALANEFHRRFPPDRTSDGGAWAVIREGKPRFVPQITDERLRRSVKDDAQRAILRELGLRSSIAVPLLARGKPFGALSFVTAESGRHYTETDLRVAEDLAHRTAVAIENARLYQEVREADRRKEEFLSLLAHELRNPLAPVRNGLQILKLTCGPDANARPAVEMMERQVQHLVRLVDDLVDVSRVMRAQVELRREPVELATVVARAVEISQPAVQAERHQFSVEVPDEPLWVDGDLVRLAQVVSNLINNAARYTPGGGSITLRVRRDGDAAVLRVKDTGIGIARDMLPKIWGMFVQADRTTKSAQVGMGIGLTLVKSLVEMHGGEVRASSDGLGRGSEFTVRLPLIDPPVKERPAANGMAVRPVARRVLVVDDNVDAAQSLALLLDLEGHRTTIAHDGPAALKLALQDPPDLAFLDIGMPGMDGYELAQKFRAEPALKDVYLVALTGWGQAEDRRRSKEAGFDVHEVKPIEPDALARVFADWQARPAVSPATP